MATGGSEMFGKILLVSENKQVEKWYLIIIINGCWDVVWYVGAF